MAPDIKNTATTLTDSESETSDVKSETSDVKTIELEENVKADCMACKAVAFTTPLMISAYLIHQHSSIEKVAAMPIAKNWIGTNRWKVKLHRFNLMFAVPICLCYTTYGYLFDFEGAYQKSNPPQSSDDFVTDFEGASQKSNPPESSDDFVTETIRSVKSDKDTFTRGTLELADWLGNGLVEGKASFVDSITKLKRIFNTESPSSVDKGKGDS